MLTKFSFLGLGVLLLGSCHPKYDLIFQYVDPLEKIIPEQTMFMPNKPVAHVAQGEYATFQFAIRCNQAISDLKVSISPFTTDSLRQTLDPGNMEISFVGNVHEGRHQITPGNDIIFSPSQFYPDPLLDDSSIDVRANTSSAIWVSIPITKDILPGTYLNEVQISGKIDGCAFTRSTQIAIKVYSVIIEDQELLAANWHYSRFDHVNFEEKVEEYSCQWWDYMEQIAKIMCEYRLNVALISPLRLAQYTFDDQGNVTAIDFERFDRAVDLFASYGTLKKIAGGHIAERFNQWTSQFGYKVPQWDSVNRQLIFTLLPHTSLRAQNFYALFFKSLKEHLHEKEWQDIYVQHIADEPIAENIDSYRAIAHFFKQQIPGCKIIEATHSTAISDLIDIWTPQLDHLEQNFEFYQQQRLQGKDVWYYTSVRPQGNYANRYIRQPLLKTRLLHWINFKYNITGYLHWGFNYWMGTNQMLETTGIQTNGVVLPGGDAWIVYPYKNHIIPSIRLAAMRDGIADYELLRKLQEADSLQAKFLVDKVIYNFQSYDMSVANFRQIRETILKALETEV